MSNPVAKPVQESSTLPKGMPAQMSSQSKYVSIIPENAQTFRAGQKIIYNLEPELGFVKGKDSYLVFDVLNNSGRGTQTATAQKNLRTELGMAGISSLIKRINIYSKHSGQLLESLDNYNQWVHTQIQYEHDDHTNHQNLEGCPKFLESKCASNVANSADASKSINNNKNLYADAENNRISACNETNQVPMYTSTRFITPLRCGIFRYWDDEKLVPILMLGGLRIEIELAPVGEALTLHYTGGRCVADMGVAAARNEGHLNADNMGNGQRLAVANLSAGTDNFVKLSLQNNVDNLDRLNASGLAVGNRVRVLGLNGGNTATGTISALTIDANGRVNVAMSNLPAGGGTQLGNATTANSYLELLTGTLTTTTVDYQITNTEFRLLRVSVGNRPPQNMNYEFTTYDLFKDTIPQTQFNFNQEVTSIASKALAIFSMFEDPRKSGSNALPTLGSNGYYSGVAAGEAGVNFNDIVYFINNKLMPLNAYDVNPKGDKVITLNELVKAWSAIGVQCKSLGSGEFADLDIYTNRFMIARQLARDGSVFNLQNAEPQIRLTFTAARGNDVHGVAYGNLNMLTYVFSKQIINISDSGLTITK